MNNIESSIVFNSTIISLGLLSYYLNSFSNSGIYFGIRIPKIYKDVEELKNLEKGYKRSVLLLFSILIILVNVILFISKNRNGEELSSILGVSTITAILIHSIIYFIYNIKLKKLKKNNNWNHKKSNVVIVDTTLRKPKKNEKYKPLNDVVFLLPILLPVFLLILTYINRRNINNYWSFDIYKFPIIGIITGFFIYFLVKISLRSRVDLNSTNIKSTIKYKKKIKKLISLFFLVTEIEIIIGYSIIQFGIIYNFYSDKLINYTNIFMTISMIVFIFIFIRMGIRERSSKENENQEEAYKDDDSNWILGMFYYNKKDPSFMIEIRVGLGYTINFANKLSILLLVFIILFTMLMTLI